MKHRNNAFVVVGIGVVCGLASPLLGWGDEGHKIVGDIAWYELTDATRAAVMSLLRTDDDAKYHRLDGSTVWADDIKRSEHPQHEEFEWARRLHYVNLPKDRRTYYEENDCRPKDDCPSDLPCPPRECVVSAINYYSAMLRDDAAPSAHKLIALKFLTHFVGDLHQPLHAGMKSDTGGGSISVRFFSSDTNLHSVWDSDIIDRHIRGAPWSDCGWRGFSEELRESIQNSDRNTWKQNLDPAVWAEESAKLAHDFAYAGSNNNRPIHDDDRLSTDYYQKSLPVVQVCLQRGGVRLGALLNKIFDGA